MYETNNGFKRKKGKVKRMTSLLTSQSRDERLELIDTYTIITTTTTATTTHEASMTSLIPGFITHTSQIFAAGSSSNFIASVPLDPSHPFYAPLKQALASVRYSMKDSKHALTVQGTT
jgi:hypothetical protein